MELLKQHALSFASQIHGPNYHKIQFFFSIRKEKYQVGLVWSNLVYQVYFGQFRFIRSISFTSVNFSSFDLLRSLRSNLVHFGLFWSNSVYFDLVGPHLSNSVYSVHSVHFGLFGLIQFISTHFGPFGPIRCIYLRMEKDKFWLRVISIVTIG